MGILIAVIGGLAAIWQTARSFHNRGDERSPLLTGTLGLTVIVCAALTADRQSQNSETIKNLLKEEKKNGEALKDEKEERVKFEMAFWEFTKSLDPNKFTIRQYVSYRQAVTATSPESPERSPSKTVTPPAVVAAMKRSLDSWGMRVSRLGDTMPDKRQDLRHRLIFDPYTLEFQKLSDSQRQKNRDDYLSGLDQLDAHDAAIYRGMEGEISQVLSDAFTMLNFSEKRQASEFSNFKLLGDNATTNTNRSENASPHQKDYQAIQTYLYNIANQL